MINAPLTVSSLKAREKHRQIVFKFDHQVIYTYEEWFKKEISSLDKNFQYMI